MLVSFPNQPLKDF